MVPLTWGEEQQAALGDIINRLTGPQVLCQPDFKKPFQLRTKASKLGLGAVLCRNMTIESTVLLPMVAILWREQKRIIMLIRWSFLRCFGQLTVSSLPVWCWTFWGHVPSQSSGIPAFFSKTGCNGMLRDGRSLGIYLDWKEAQAQDPVLKVVQKLVSGGQLPSRQ